jgi:hypothetical protein
MPRGRYEINEFYEILELAQVCGGYEVTNLFRYPRAIPEHPE